MTQLPDKFKLQVAQLLGQEEAEGLCRALLEEPTVSVRVNRAKAGCPPQDVENERVPWCETGYYLSSRPSFTLDPLFHAGTYYVQEASSMFIEQAFKTMDFQPQRMLDLCAAPGGKSTLWRSLLPDGALLVANEPIRQRAMILLENLTKWGHPDVVVTNAYPEDFAPLRGFFDVVATDVPCSGEGMFRKEEKAVEDWSPEAVDHCAARQWQIVCDIWPTLREGGYLVYSTCTFNREENEDQVDRICQELGAEVVPVSVDASWGVCGDTTGRHLPVSHFFPNHARGEGLFLALLRKTSADDAPAKNKKQKKRRPTPPVAGGKNVAQWLANDGDFKLFRPDETHICAVRNGLFEDVERVCNTVRSLSAGIVLAEEKGRKYAPTTELALSTQRNEAAFPKAELTLEEAVAYLRKETLMLSSEVPRGYVLACYQGHPMGFLNNLGSRANNLYTTEWRIRTKTL